MNFVLHSLNGKPTAPHPVYSIGLVKCLMTRIHRYSVMQSSFSALEILCAPPSLTSPLSPPLATTPFFITSIVLPFPYII